MKFVYLYVLFILLINIRSLSLRNEPNHLQKSNKAKITSVTEKNSLSKLPSVQKKTIKATNLKALKSNSLNSKELRKNQWSQKPKRYPFKKPQAQSYILNHSAVPYYSIKYSSKYGMVYSYHALKSDVLPSMIKK